jgi:hypothetical protein
MHTFTILLIAVVLIALTYAGIVHSRDLAKKAPKEKNGVTSKPDF